MRCFDMRLAWRAVLLVLMLARPWSARSGVTTDGLKVIVVRPTALRWNVVVDVE